MSPGCFSERAVLKSPVSEIGESSMKVILSPTSIPAIAAGGFPSISSVTTTPSFA